MNQPFAISFAMIISMHRVNQNRVLIKKLPFVETMYSGVTIAIWRSIIQCTIRQGNKLSYSLFISTRY